MQEMEASSWSNFKTLVSNKTLLIQYSDNARGYNLYASEASVFMWHIWLPKDEGSDVTDFENNFKAAANAPLMVGGGTLSAHITGEAQIFTNEAIRDTAAHNSSAGQNSGFRVKTIIVQSTLNQDVSIQCQGSRDGTNWFNIGTAWPVTASTNAYQTCETYFPYLRGIATCAVAPSSGTLNLWLERMGS